jgi:hypothetical protein
MAAVGGGGGGPAPTIAERLTACKLEIERLKAAISQARLGLMTGGLRDVPGTRKALGPALKRVRTLTGHHGKVYAADWSQGGDQLVSTGCVSAAQRRAPAPRIACGSRHGQIGGVGHRRRRSQSRALDLHPVCCCASPGLLACFALARP